MIFESVSQTVQLTHNWYMQKQTAKSVNKDCSQDTQKSSFYKQKVLCTGSVGKKVCLMEILIQSLWTGGLSIQGLAKSGLTVMIHYAFCESCKYAFKAIMYQKHQRIIPSSAISGQLQQYASLAALLSPLSAKWELGIWLTALLAS